MDVALHKTNQIPYLTSSFSSTHAPHPDVYLAHARVARMLTFVIYTRQGIDNITTRITYDIKWFSAGHCWVFGRLILVSEAVLGAVLVQSAEKCISLSFQPGLNRAAHSVYSVNPLHLFLTGSVV